MKFAVLALLTVCLFASTIDNYVNLMGKDSCAAKVVTTLRPEIEAAAAKAENFNDKVEFLSLLSKAKEMMEACPQETFNPANADIIEKDGIALLLGSNCEKDLGMMLLIGDEVVKNPKDIPQDIIITIFEGILGMQAKKDCEQYIHYITPHH